MSPARRLAARRSASPGPGRVSSASGWVALALWVFIASLGLSRLLQFGGTPNRFVAIWQALLPWQLLVAIPAMIVAAALRRWRTLAVLGVAVASLMPLIVRWHLLGTAVKPGSNPTLRIVASNVLFDNPHLREAFDDVAEVDADVVVLSEVTADGRALLADHPLGQRYAYSVQDPFRIGIVVLSKYPFVADAAGDWVTGESQAMTLDVDGAEVRLIASHPPPPVFTTKVWAAELAMIGNDVNAFEGPTIVAGDLNAGWVLPPFRDMIEVGNLTDAMGAAGHHWTMTWPTKGLLGIPYATLDHILVNRQLGVYTAEAFDVSGSDHRGLSAELILEPPTAN